MDLSLSSAWRLRVNHAQDTAESSLNSMAEEVKRKNGKVFVHFDEVEVEQDLSGVRKKQARLAVLVSSPVLDKADQLISAVPLDSKSGADVAEAVYLTLAEQELEERVMGIICDTTASNFGRFSGAVTCLQVRNRISCVLTSFEFEFKEILGYPVLIIPCAHHIEELPVKHVQR